jgi:N-acetylmuramoyl-L-alanine amidase
MGLSVRQFLGAQLALLVGCRKVDAASVPSVSVGGVEYVQLTFIARLYSMEVSGEGRTILLRNRYNSIEFTTNGSEVRINGIRVWLHDPCVKAGRQWSVRVLDFSKVIDPILRSYAYVPPSVPSCVVLDPGHGGKDPGAIGSRNVQEKLVVKDVSQRAKRHLEAAGIRVKLTRERDLFLSLQERCNLAAKAGAGLFVSIHADAASNPAAHGVGVFVLTAAGCSSTGDSRGKGDLGAGKGNAYDAANSVLGFSIQSNLVKKSGRADRGVRRARFYVIKNVACPAALVECGFVSNKEEESLMIQADYREAVARGISNGIIGYMTQVNRAVKRKR